MNLKKIVIGLTAIVAASTIAVTSASAAWATGAGPEVKTNDVSFRTWAYGPNNSTRVYSVEIQGTTLGEPARVVGSHFELYGMYPGVGYGWLQDFPGVNSNFKHTYSFGSNGYDFPNGTQLCSRWWSPGNQEVTSPSCVSVHS